MAAGPFTAAADGTGVDNRQCTVAISNNYDTVGTLTRATINTLTPTTLKTLFTTDSGATWVDVGPWFKTAFEMAACGIRRNGLHDWIFSSMKKMGHLVSVQRIEKSPSLVLPFVLARQLSVINHESWRVLGASTKADITGGTAGTAITVFTTSPLPVATLALDAVTHVIRVDTTGGFDMNIGWFLGAKATPVAGDKSMGDRVNLFTRLAGAAKMGQYVVIQAATNTAKTYVDIAVAEEKPVAAPFGDGATSADAPLLPAVATANTIKGLLLAGGNNVSDFESWCQNRPTLNPEKRVPFWIQTSRKARRVDEIYKEVFGRLMRDNQYFGEFVDQPLAEKNRQDEEEWQRRRVNQFFFNKPISDNQTLNLYTSLEQIVTTTPTISGAGASSTQGKFVTYRANAVGVYEQLRACGRVFDIGGGSAYVSLKELFDEIYQISRSRKSRGRNGNNIDIYTDSQTAAAFDRAMSSYYALMYGSHFRTTMNLQEGRNEPFGFFWRSYRLNHPAGVQINVITHEWFDDFRSALTPIVPGGVGATSLDSRGRLFLILDLGKGGIYPGIIASNRKVRTLGELENLAKIDPTYFCTLEHFTEQVTLTSETMTAVVECPSDNLWLENFNGFSSANADGTFADYGTAGDFIGDPAGGIYS